jgi:alcohol dehydrogenase class IV
MLPHVIKYNIAGSPEKYARAAALMGQEIEGLSMLEAAESAVEAIQELLDTIDVSYHLKDYGIHEEDLPKLVTGAMKQSRLFVPNPRDLNENDLTAIYQQAY